MSVQPNYWPDAAPTADELESLHLMQMKCWPMAADNFAALSHVQLRRAGVWEVQFNPARARSATARVDSVSVMSRPCFLCVVNRPDDQLRLRWRDYDILVNPFPIFERHYTVACESHIPQGLKGRVGDMAELARSLRGYVVFYNGPHCGASAPDHMHLQIALWPGVSELLRHRSAVRRVLRFGDVAEAEAAIAGNDDVNVLAVDEGGDGVGIYVIPRRAHRPADYERTLISPGAVDVAGRIITVWQHIYDRLDEQAIEAVFAQVCEPQI